MGKGDRKKSKGKGKSKGATARQNRKGKRTTKLQVGDVFTSGAHELVVEEAYQDEFGYRVFTRQLCTNGHYSPGMKTQLCYQQIGDREDRPPALILRGTTVINRVIKRMVHFGEDDPIKEAISILQKRIDKVLEYLDNYVGDDNDLMILGPRIEKILKGVAS